MTEPNKEPDFFELVYGVPPYINSMSERELREYAQRALDAAREALKECDDHFKTAKESAKPDFWLNRVKEAAERQYRLGEYAQAFADRIKVVREGGDTEA